MATGPCQVVGAANSAPVNPPRRYWTGLRVLASLGTDNPFNSWRPRRTKPQELPMFAVWQLIDTIISLYMWALIISVALSWLVQFNVINTSNRFVYTIGDFLFRVTDPVLRRIRSIIPSLGGIDLSPMILILALIFIRNLLPDLLGVR
jgi:YggT family protein